MRCNACWRELEGKAVSTTCGHILCTEDAGKILSNDAACPICDQVLSRSLMKPVEINPGDEWINVRTSIKPLNFYGCTYYSFFLVTFALQMAMAGISPQILMKSAYRSVMFYIGQKELEMQYKMNTIIGQCRQKCEAMQAKFTEKLEQVHTAYQKAAKRCQMMEQEIDNLSKDKQELQEKYAEKSRQKRKLDEMYDQLRHEYESVKRSAIQPAGNFFQRADPDLFSGMGNLMDGREPVRQDRFTPDTPGQREDLWPGRQKNSNPTAFDLSGGSPAKTATIPVDSGGRRPTRPIFGTGVSNPSATLRNLIISPMKRPQLSRSRPQMFTL